MVKQFVTFMLLIAASLAASAQIKVAVVDTGLNYPNGVIPICDKKAFGPEGDSSDVRDTHGHGTSISGLIHSHAPKGYCQIVIKYDVFTTSSFSTYIQALTYALNSGAHIVNLSIQGLNRRPIEDRLIKQMLDKGMIVVAAAGNNGFDLDVVPNYPASVDSRIYVVGSRNGRGISDFSNYGKDVDCYAFGENTKGVIGNGGTGTSQAAAIISGQLAKHLSGGGKLYNFKCGG